MKLLSLKFHKNANLGTALLTIYDDLIQFFCIIQTTSTRIANPQKFVGRLAFSVSQSPIQFHVLTLTLRKFIAKIAVDREKLL